MYGRERRPTTVALPKGAALAIRSRMLLYSARKLFNGNDLYKGVIDKYGNPLFPPRSTTRRNGRRPHRPPKT